MPGSRLTYAWDRLRNPATRRKKSSLLRTHVIRVRFAIRVGGLYSQNIVHVRVGLASALLPNSSRFRMSSLAFKYAIDVLMQTTKDDVV